MSILFCTLGEGLVMANQSLIKFNSELIKMLTKSLSTSHSLENVHI